MLTFICLGLLIVVPTVIYIFLVWNFDHWHRRGIRSAKARPLMGSFPSLLTQKQHFADDINEIYKQYKSSERFIGTFLMRTPQLLILDPKLAHEVYVTAFKNFQDNDVAKLVDKRKDPLVANNPFVLAGQDWKDQRALVSPGLTGSRIKVAYEAMQQVCHQLCDYIERECKIAAGDGLNGKDLALRFTSENVSDCVLGIKAQSFTDSALPISENVKKFTDNNTIFVIYSLMVGLYPNIVKYYKAKFFPKDSEDFFLKLMQQAYSLRRATKVDRQDFMNHLLTLQQKKQFDDAELASHTMTFLIDGLDTTAAVISHCLLLLGRVPEAQERLREEIMRNADANGNLSFEQLNELPYLDACLHETMHIFPPGLMSMKRCTEPYEFTNKDGRKLKVQLDDAVIIPVHAFHHDPDYYAEPEMFKPERFMPENGGLKKYRDMGIFLGFGDGPRMCLGMRFALVQTKAAIAAVVRNFDINVNPKTKKENKLDPKTFVALQDGGVWLDFQKRI